MTTTYARRRNARALPWVRTLGFVILTLAFLTRVPFYPSGLVPVLALAVGGLALFSAPLAVLAAVLVFALPLMAADLLVGLVFLIVGIAISQFLGRRSGAPFLILGFAGLAMLVDASWGLVALAGYAIGAGDGAIVAFAACAGLELAGIALGREAIGVLATGGTTPLLDPTTLAPGEVRVAGETYSALGFGWFAPAFGEIDVPATLAVFGGIERLGRVVAQPLVWAGAAALAGSLRPAADDPERVLKSLGAVGAGVAVAAAVSAGAAAILGGPPSGGTFALGAVASLLPAIPVVLVSEVLFRPVAETSSGRAERSLRAEDADVDELLRAMADAEDALAAKHTADAVVLITDMKSFSRMTEVDGSMITAKAIQRHRDLLLPIIGKHGGKGKSTGGDGLLARFDRPGDALAAAVAIQAALEDHNARHPDDRAVSIRIGIAEGQVVVDKRGRPFIGDALNRAARIMDLADGGQILATKSVVDRSPGGPRTFDHGPYHVKNIAEPLDVREVLWADRQEPRSPRSEMSGSGVEPQDAEDAIGGSA